MTKAFTDIEQSKKLVEILPLDSADMKFPYFGDGQYGTTAVFGEPLEFSGGKDIPCWSLAALLEIIPEVFVERRIPDGWDCVSYAECQITKAENFKNSIDACVEVILKLHKLKYL